MSSRIIRASSEGAKRIAPFRIAPAREGPGDPFVPDSAADAAEWVGPNVLEQQGEPTIGEGRALSEIEKEAYEKGFDEGQKAGCEIGEKMVEALLKQYSASLEELNNLRRNVLAISEREVIHLALEIARKIIKREVAIDEEIILTLVKVALKRVGDQTLITIRVNPKDYNVIQRYPSIRSGSEPLNDGIKLVEDSLISRGGCVIETESGLIDARIEEQLREIGKGFLE